MAYQSNVQSLLQQYIPDIPSYNEVLDSNDGIQPDWETFFSSLLKIGPEEIQNRNNDILRLMKENGVAYNIYNDPSGQSRPWELDPIPKIISAKEYLINPAGEWMQGGFDSDTGLSGRKLIVDNYGPEIPIGGGSFSGKDYTKVDRSGAYMARRIAVDYLRKYNAKHVYTKLAYAIGKAEPVMAIVVIDGKEMEITGYDLSPRGIYIGLELASTIYKDTSDWGHFGRGFSWDK